jgi:DNA-binding NarL/FixJ family response regulator
MRRLKVLVADDHELMVVAVELALSEAADDFEVVGTTTRGTQLLPLAAQTHPDLVVLDLRMPGMDGLTCLELLRQRHPKIKTVVLSAVDDPKVIQAAFTHGAAAYILKQVDPRDLPSALRQAYAGTVVQPVLGEPEQRTAGETNGVILSERERAILDALCKGKSNKQIAGELWLAEQTVKFHLTNLYRKLEVSTRTEAVNVAYRRGLLESPLLAAADDR